MSLLRQIGLGIALFALVGVGLGLSGYISLTAAIETLAGGDLQSAGGIVQSFILVVGLQSAFVVFLLGSVVAAITGSRIADEANSLKIAVLSNGLASFVGFYIMVAIALVIMFYALSTGDATAGGGGTGGGTGEINIQQFARPILQIGLPTGLVGTGAGGVFHLLE